MLVAVKLLMVSSQTAKRIMDHDMREFSHFCSDQTGNLKVDYFSLTNVDDVGTN